MSDSLAKLLMGQLATLQRSSGGRAVLAEECEAARNALGDRVPDWYWELLQSTPLCGTTLGIPARSGNYSHQLLFLSPAQMLEEALSCIPGCHILRLGYVPIAGCATGSGNPYFCRFDGLHQSEIVQVDHSIPPELLHIEIPPLGSWPIAASLEDLFRKAREAS